MGNVSSAATVGEEGGGRTTTTDNAISRCGVAGYLTFGECFERGDRWGGGRAVGEEGEGRTTTDNEIILCEIITGRYDNKTVTKTINKTINKSNTGGLVDGVPKAGSSTAGNLLPLVSTPAMGVTRY